MIQVYILVWNNFYILNSKLNEKKSIIHSGKVTWCVISGMSRFFRIWAYLRKLDFFQPIDWLISHWSAMLPCLVVSIYIYFVLIGLLPPSLWSFIDKYFYINFPFEFSSWSSMIIFKITMWWSHISFYVKLMA